MGDAIDLTGDGGVLKTIIKQAKPDALTPTENLPLVDGMLLSLTTVHSQCTYEGFYKIMGRNQHSIMLHGWFGR